MLFALLSWAATGIFFDRDEIVCRRFFLVESRYPIRNIKRVSFDRNEDGFGAIMPTVTIELNNGKRILLINFKNSDINEMLDRIKMGAPDIDSKYVMNEIEANKIKYSNWRSSFRPGDAFLFGAGLVIVVLFILWWLSQKYWIA